MNGAARWNGLRLYQWAVGLCDSMTGLMLVLAPEWTLRLMRIRTLPDSPEMVSFVGVFVLAVGVAYLTVTRVPQSEADAAQWRAVWRVTAISRLLVAGYVGWQVVQGVLEPAWASVVATDLLFATIQFTGLGRGWLAPLRPEVTA